MTTQKAPNGSGAGGRRLWRSVADFYELDEHEAALLTEACRTVDVLADLDKIIRDKGPIMNTPAGPKAHPAVVEARQQRIALARLLAALRLPAGAPGDEQKGARQPQRRSGARGVYQIRPAS